MGMDESHRGERTQYLIANESLKADALRQLCMFLSPCPHFVGRCRPPVDNSSLLCESHGKVSHHNVSKMKRISPMAWAQLVSQVRTMHPLTH